MWRSNCLAAAILLSLCLGAPVGSEEACNEQDEGTYLLQSSLQVQVTRGTDLAATKVGHYDVDAMELSTPANLSSSSRATHAFVQEHSQTQRGKTRHEDSGAQTAAEKHTTFWELKMFFVIFGSYGLACLVYEVAHLPNPDGYKESRVIEWDAVKLLWQACVVTYHMQYFIRIDGQTVMLAMEGNERVLSNPDTARIVSESDAHRNNFLEYCFTGYHGVYGLSGLAFVSGVFAQKVTKEAMLALCCYTYGTYFIWMLIGVGLHNGTHGAVREPHWQGENAFWYLIELFWWRVTLSPIFHMVKDRPLSTRINVFIAVALALYTSYDLFESIEPKLYAFQARTGIAVPSYSYFNLGPYYALGLILPVSEWTRLVRVPSLQWIAYIGFWGMYQVPLWVVPAYQNWVEQNRNIALNWPTYMDASRAFTISRLAEHLFWFVFKGIPTMSSIWILAQWVAALYRLMPIFTTTLVSGGERALFAYVLHLRLVDVLADVCHAHDFVNDISPLAWCLGAWIFSSITVWIFCSQLTMKLLWPLVVPLWMLKPLAMAGLLEEKPRKPPAEKTVDKLGEAAPLSNKDVAKSGA
eukprot:TRINITY_DN11224_c0_g1_i1.p1 TRINITY_DN11224_c0_g1~~TRINITY_DN11224_c0_g1_i1.p1  ORF type:complete len:581 (+),score=64.30 TRINITY_DN11224_c0_g1_i1:60-1802(+)